MMNLCRDFMGFHYIFFGGISLMFTHFTHSCIYSSKFFLFTGARLLAVWKNDVSGSVEIFCRGLFLGSQGFHQCCDSRVWHLVGASIHSGIYPLLAARIFFPRKWGPNEGTTVELHEIPVKKASILSLQQKTHGVDRIFVCAFRFSHHSAGLAFPSFSVWRLRDPTMDGACMTHDEVSSTSTATFGSWMPQLQLLGEDTSRRTSNGGTVYSLERDAIRNYTPYLKKRMQVEEAKGREKQKNQRNTIGTQLVLQKADVLPKWDRENHYTTYQPVFRPLHTAPNDLPRYSNLPTRACPWGENPQVCCFLFEFFGVSLFSVPGGCVWKCVLFCADFLSSSTLCCIFIWGRFHGHLWRR